MKQTIISLAAIGSLFIAACGNNSSTNEHEGHNHAGSEATSAASTDAPTVAPTVADADPKLSAQVQSIVQHYIHVQTALANDDATEATSGAKMIGSVIEGFDASALPAAQKQTYDEHVSHIKAHAREIATATDIKAKRTAFEPLSTHTYNLVKAFGANGAVYHAHCPMAFDGKGAMWLATNKEIRNPYYGSEMLECGEVKEVIKK